MMNNINSILLEGKLTRDAEMKEIDDVSVCVMELESARYSRKGKEKWNKTTVCINVHAAGKLAESCVKSGHSGRGLRVVGHIAQRCYFADGEAWKDIFIFADHVEFRPEMPVEG
jgi:single-strand DNA-binding protein